MESLNELAKEYPPGRKTSNVRIKYPQLYDELVRCTSFLPTSATTSQRLWHIRNDQSNVPLCHNEGCDNPVNGIAKNSDYAKIERI